MTTIISRSLLIMLILCVFTTTYSTKTWSAPTQIFKMPYTIPLSKTSDKVIVNKSPFALGACIALKREQITRAVGTKELSISYNTHYLPRFKILVSRFFTARKACGNISKCFARHMTLSDFRVLKGYMKTRTMLKKTRLTPFKLKLHTLAACGKLARASNPSATMSTKALFRRASQQSPVRNPFTRTRKNNFLLGLCYVHGSTTPGLSACNKPSARNRNSRVTIYQVFNQSSVSLNLVFSNQFRSYMKRRGSRVTIRDREFTLPVTYKVISDNVVVATMTNKKGCTSVNRYIREGSGIYQESINQYGNCGANQRAAYLSSKRAGRKKIYYIK